MGACWELKNSKGRAGNTSKHRDHKHGQGAHGSVLGVEEQQGQGRAGHTSKDREEFVYLFEHYRTHAKITELAVVACVAMINSVGPAAQ